MATEVLGFQTLPVKPAPSLSAAPPRGSSQSASCPAQQYRKGAVRTWDLSSCSWNRVTQPKQLKGRCVDVFSFQFQRTPVHHTEAGMAAGREAPVAEVRRGAGWSHWSHCIHIKEVERPSRKRGLAVKSQGPPAVDHFLEESPTS